MYIRGNVQWRGGGSARAVRAFHSGGSQWTADLSTDDRPVIRSAKKKIKFGQNYKRRRENIS